MKPSPHPPRQNRSLLLAILLSALLLPCLLLPHSPFLQVLLAQTAVTLPSIPKIFGPFHLTWLLLCLTLSLLALRFGKRSPDRLDDAVFASGCLLLVLEVYKQLLWQYALGNGHYNFGILPLQFCSFATPLYLILPLMREGKAKQGLYAFCALYQTMGGCIVMAYPMFYPQIALSVHTMLWHTVMIATGMAILSARGIGKHYLRDLIPSSLCFFCVFAVGIAGNFLLTPLAANSPQPLNLFYLHPDIPNHYIIIGDVQKHLGYLPSLITYVLLFVSIGAHTVWGVGALSHRIPIGSKRTTHDKL